jgi:hypothetical protein
MAPPSIDQLDDIPASVLAKIASRLLIDPLSTATDYQLNDLSDSEASALDRVIRSLRTSVEAVSTQKSERVRLLSRISELLRDRALNEGREQRAVDRLGERGQLNLSDYAVMFDSRSWSVFEDLGERRSNIEESLRKADAVEHRLPEPGQRPGFPALSLFGKVISPKQSQSFVMLVQSERKASTLVVTAAWRIPQYIATEHKRPSKMLEAFVGRFGLDFRAPDEAPSERLIQYKEWRSQVSGEMPRNWIQVANPKDHNNFPSVTFHTAPNGVLKVTLAYVIDLDEYKRFLRSLKSASR